MNLLRKLKQLFKRRGKNMDELKEGIDFRFQMVNEISAVAIISGKYDGVVVAFNDVSISEPENINGVDTPPYLSFHYDIISGVDFSDEELLDDEEFKNHIGNILMNVIVNSNTTTSSFTDALDETIEYTEI
jgi:hypothetical protein